MVPTGTSQLMGSPTGSASGLKGSGYREASLQRFSPEQMELFKSLFGQVAPGSYLSRLAGGDQELFKEIEAPALAQFGQLQSDIANRFSGMGMGARRSSGFQQAQGSAASQFAQQLQAQRMGLQRQALQDLMANSQMILGQNPYEQFVLPEKKSFLEELMTALAGGASQGIGSVGSMYAMSKLGLLR